MEVRSLSFLFSPQTTDCRFPIMHMVNNIRLFPGPHLDLAVCIADLAPECALFYQRYGEALFQKAQSESDVFGASLQKASRNRQQDNEEAAEEAEDEENDKAQRAFTVQTGSIAPPALPHDCCQQVTQLTGNCSADRTSMQ